MDTKRIVFISHKMNIEASRANNEATLTWYFLESMPAWKNSGYPWKSTEKIHYSHGLVSAKLAIDSKTQPWSTHMWHSKTRVTCIIECIYNFGVNMELRKRNHPDRMLYRLQTKQLHVVIKLREQMRNKVTKLSYCRFLGQNSINNPDLS